MIGIIIQARMTSSRLPGKVLMKIGNKTLLDHIIFRLSFLKRCDTKVVIATSNLSTDDVIEEFCKNKKLSCFRGSETNVLERYYICAKENNFSHVIRLTGDNPFTDIEELSNLIESHLDMGADYSHSFGELPIGAGAEIFDFESLEKSFKEGKEPQHLEHVNEYILENPEIFRINILRMNDEKNYPKARLTVDTMADYYRVCYIVSNSKNEYITIQEAVKLCMQYV